MHDNGIFGAHHCYFSEVNYTVLVNSQHCHFAKEEEEEEEEEEESMLQQNKSRSKAKRLTRHELA